MFYVETGCFAGWMKLVDANTKKGFFKGNYMGDSKLIYIMILNG
jgi:hypothetical protein